MTIFLEPVVNELVYIIQKVKLGNSVVGIEDSFGLMDGASRNKLCKSMIISNSVSR